MRVARSDFALTSDQLLPARVASLEAQLQQALAAIARLEKRSREQEVTTRECALHPLSYRKPCISSAQISSL